MVKFKPSTKEAPNKPPNQNKPPIPGSMSQQLAFQRRLKASRLARTAAAASVGNGLPLPSPEQAAFGSRALELSTVQRGKSTPPRQ